MRNQTTENKGMQLHTDCTFFPLADESRKINLEAFDCGDDDLNEFFKEDAIAYSKSLLGKTYGFVHDNDETNTIICMFTISNDSLKVDSLPNNRKKKLTKKIPQAKQHKSYPAVLIGRLGVASEFSSRGIGRQLMQFIKAWFIDSSNKTGCRFLIVDAYNTEHPIQYYKKNEFQFLFSTEEQEKHSIGMKEDEKLKTRVMYFDLFTLIGK